MKPQIYTQTNFIIFLLLIWYIVSNMFEVLMEKLESIEKTLGDMLKLRSASFNPFHEVKSIVLEGVKKAINDILEVQTIDKLSSMRKEDMYDVLFWIGQEHERVSRYLEFHRDTLVGQTWQRFRGLRNKLLGATRAVTKGVPVSTAKFNVKTDAGLDSAVKGKCYVMSLLLECCWSLNILLII